MEYSSFQVSIPQTKIGLKENFLLNWVGIIFQCTKLNWHFQMYFLKIHIRYMYILNEMCYLYTYSYLI
jgi:hypothetical protein